MADFIYMDNAATTFPKAETTYEAMDDANRNLAVNAGRGSYALAKRASSVIDEVRVRLCRLMSAETAAEVFLTTSATAAFNQIANGLSLSKNDIVYVSPFEHNAVMRTLHRLQEINGFTIQELPLKDDICEIDTAKTKYMFSQNRPTLVCMSHVSNVTGYILPVNDITEAAKECGATVVIDGAQACGLIPTDLRKLMCDFYIFAGHKTLYGPFGAAGFFKRIGARLEPVMTGGTGTDSLGLDMPAEGYERYEAGSHNIVAIAGLNASLAELPTPQEILVREQQLTEQIVQGLGKIQGVRLYVPTAENHVGIISFNIQGYKASETGMILDEDYNIAVRTGYHCAPLIHAHLHDEDHAGTVRVSIGRFTTEEDIQKLIEAVGEISKG